MEMIEPVAVWDVRPWGCPAFRVGDFNGDGRNEVLFVQTAGAHANEAFDPRFPEVQGYKTGVEDQELFCLTLTDGEGNILWQVGEPWALERPFSWNGSNFCEVVDLDGDGQVEVMFVHRAELMIYKGATGALYRRHKLPHSGFYFARAVRSDHSGRYHIFTKSVTTSATHSYGNPSLLLDHAFNVVWEQEVEGAGHGGNTADVDGDGLDELLIGFSLFDHDGTPLWSHSPMSENDHLDDSVIADIDGDGRFEFALAHDGHDAVVHNADGTERFRVAMHHCQNIWSGKFFEAEPGLQLAFVDKAIGKAEDRTAAVVSADGRELSRHRTMGYYSVIGWPTDLGTQSLIRLEWPVEPDADRRVLWVDPTGRELARLKVRENFYDRFQKYGLDTFPGRGRYFGTCHTAAVGDLDGDGRDEFLITDRERVWVFQQP